MKLSDLLWIAVVLCAAIAMLLLLKLYKRNAASSPEWIRKLAHLSTGALAICFPWIFSSTLPVYIVCGLSVLLLVSIRIFGPMRTRLSGVLDAVDRNSWGEFYFPLSVAILFSLARGDKLLYVIPLLVLTFADAVGALLGTRYGRYGYRGMGGAKTLEGSVAFFTMAFLAVHVPLLLLTGMGRPQTLLVAIDIALIVTLLEAVAWRGLDNLLIPLGVFLLLHIYSDMSIELLLLRLVASVFLLIFVLLYRSRTTLEGSALLASVLVLYASWALDGWRWLLAPAVLFASYSWFFPGKATEIEQKHNVYAVTSVAFAGLLWIFIATVDGKPELLFPYTVGYCVHLTILGWTLICARFPARSSWRAGPLLVTRCWLLIFTPYLLAQGFSLVSLEQTAIALAICALAFGAFCLIEPRTLDGYSVKPSRWIRQGVFALIVSGLVAGVQELR
jgi:phytol kinase